MSSVKSMREIVEEYICEVEEAYDVMNYHDFMNFLIEKKVEICEKYTIKYFFALLERLNKIHEAWRE